jgi:hypothetical protein
MISMISKVILLETYRAGLQSASIGGFQWKASIILVPLFRRVRSHREAFLAGFISRSHYVVIHMLVCGVAEDVGSWSKLNHGQGSVGDDCVMLIEMIWSGVCRVHYYVVRDGDFVIGTLNLLESSYNLPLILQLELRTRGSPFQLGTDILHIPPRNNLRICLRYGETFR